MTLDISGGIRQRLVDDGALVAMLETYAFETGPAPAVLLDPVPYDLTFGKKATIVVDEPHNQAAVDDYSTPRRRVDIRLRLYALHDGSTVAINAAAERVRALLHLWNTPSFSTGELEGASVNGPTPAPTDDPSIAGRLLSVQLQIKE